MSTPDHVLHPGAAELAEDLADAGLHTAAAVVRLSLRALAPIITGEVAGRQRAGWEVTSAQLDAWGRGDDARVATSNAAWRVRGCEQCALAALRTDDARTVCEPCAKRREDD